MIDSDAVPPMSDEPEEEETTWEPVDLVEWLNGDIQQQEPTMGLARNDGQRFIYPGREHALVGETESGKTWFALACAAAEIIAGGDVLYIHYEEGDPISTIERLHILGIESDLIKLHLRFVTPQKPVKAEWVEALMNPMPTMVIHDGVNEAMSLIGADVTQVDGASTFRRKLVTPFTRAGAASIACDHVTKDKESRGRDAYGSVHKGNALDGARIMLETKETFGRGLRGVAYVFVTKDRPGMLRAHGRPDKKMPGKTFVGTLVVDDSDTFEPTTLTLYAPTPDDQPPEGEDGGGADEALQSEIYQALITRPVESTRTLRARLRAAGIKFRNIDVQNALDDLFEEGKVIVTRGARNAKGYEAVSGSQEDDSQ
jgi:hypothetical protein